MLDSNCFVRLVDFGLSIEMSETEQGIAVGCFEPAGTLPYMAPEIIAIIKKRE